MNDLDTIGYFLFMEEQERQQEEETEDEDNGGWSLDHPALWARTQSPNSLGYAGIYFIFIKKYCII